MKTTKKDLSGELRQAAAQREAEAVATAVAHRAVAWQAAHPRATMEELRDRDPATAPGVWRAVGAHPAGASRSYASRTGAALREVWAGDAV